MHIGYLIVGLIFAILFMWIAAQSGISTWQKSSAESTWDRDWIRFAGFWTGLVFAGSAIRAIMLGATYDGSEAE